MLTIDWPKSESAGYVDHISVDTWSKDCTDKRVEYYILGPKGVALKATCGITARDNTADFNYDRKYAPDNEENAVDIGLMRIVFSNKERQEVTEVLWKPRAKRKLENVGAVFALQDEDVALFEGGKRLVSHIRSERNPVLKREKVDRARALGKLLCEGCGADLEVKYGKYAHACYEVHHDHPLASGVERATSLSDLSILCANCHRVIHAMGVPGVARFKAMVRRP